MTSYNPPLENLPIFDSSVFDNVEEPLTASSAGTQFLKFPTAQGTETFSDIIVLGTSSFNGTETHNGQIIANNTITQNNTGTNINQTDHTNNNLGNVLRKTDMYGDFRLLRPSGVNGGALFLTDVTTQAFGTNFTQQFQAGINFAIISSALNGNITLNCTNSGNTQRQLLYAQPSAGVYVQGWQTDNGGSLFKVAEMVSGKAISFIPGSTSGILNPLVQNGDNQIICSEGAAQNGSVLVAGIWSNVCNGLKVNGPAGTTSIGQGGVGGTFTNSFSCSNTNSTINGPAVFSSTTPPTSAQTIPASNDSSNKIPTTAWVQTAIGATTSLKYLRGSVQTIGTSATLTPLNFLFTGANWAIAEFFTLKIYFRQEWNEISTTALPIYYNSYTGLIDVYPYRCPTTGATTNLLSGSINGNTTFNITGSPAYAPLGRFYWTENYSESNTRAATGLDTANPIQITTGNQSQFIFSFGSPFPSTNNSTSNSTTTIYIELINPGITNQAITISGGTSFTNFYSTF